MLDKKISIRPIIEGISDKKGISISEEFQNRTLRPIIKLQHALIIEMFKQYALIRKNNLNEMSDEKIIGFIDNSLSKDLQLKNQFIGIVIGHFTVQEHQKYSEIKSEIHKRILNIIKKRLIDSLRELK